MCERIPGAARWSSPAADRGCKARRPPGRPGRYGEDRVGEEMQRQSAMGECESDRVDQEGHVVADHLHDRVRAGIAVFALSGVEYAHPGAAPAALAREFKMRQRRRRQVAGSTAARSSASTFAKYARRYRLTSMPRAPCGSRAAAASTALTARGMTAGS